MIITWMSFWQLKYRIQLHPNICCSPNVSLHYLIYSYFPGIVEYIPWCNRPHFVAGNLNPAKGKRVHWDPCSTCHASCLVQISTSTYSPREPHMTFSMLVPESTVPMVAYASGMVPVFAVSVLPPNGSITSSKPPSTNFPLNSPPFHSLSLLLYCAYLLHWLWAQDVSPLSFSESDSLPHSLLFSRPPMPARLTFLSPRPYPI